MCSDISTASVYLNRKLLLFLPWLLLKLICACCQCAESLARIQAGLINTGNKRERVKILHKKSESADSWWTEHIRVHFKMYKCSNCLTTLLLIYLRVLKVSLCSFCVSRLWLVFLWCSLWCSWGPVEVFGPPVHRPHRVAWCHEVRVHPGW